MIYPFVDQIISVDWEDARTIDPWTTTTDLLAVTPTIITTIGKVVHITCDHLVVTTGFYDTEGVT